jgi:hypothetical protein
MLTLSQVEPSLKEGRSLAFKLRTTPGTKTRGSVDDFVLFCLADNRGDEIVYPFSADNIVCVKGFCRTEIQIALQAGHFYSAVVRAYNLGMSFSDVQSSNLHIRDTKTSIYLLLMLLLLVSGSVIVLLAALYLFGYGCLSNQKNKKNHNTNMARVKSY